MQGRRIRALVLAAGLGTRLRPLTEQLPKPLLPVRGVPLLGHILTQLATFGCEAAAVNLHYLGEPIRQHFGDAHAGMPITWSEEPEILGTLGALHPLKEFFAPADLVLLVNGDSLCRWPLRKLVRKHLSGGARSTLLLVSRPDPAPFGGGVGVDRAGRILSFRPGDPERGTVARRYVFAGAHVFAPDLLARVGPGKADIVRDLYIPMLEEDERLASVLSAGRWHDLGTPQRFLDATLDWARAEGPERLWRRSWISPEASLGAGAQMRMVSIEAGARVGEEARVERSILLPGARIGKGCVVRESILGFGASVPPGTWVERRIIMPQLAGFSPGLDDSVVGGAVYTPFGREDEG
ncbi:MAG: mannose-phosphate guanylyltransferase [Acidobacteriota bacterium]|jgi:NDP-sugar pyrophosphorylase family protein|nr:mannose-phosphate guanylyltransferase [Acidobacteriota bacterium]